MTPRYFTWLAVSSPFLWIVVLVTLGTPFNLIDALRIDLTHACALFVTTPVTTLPMRRSFAIEKRYLINNRAVQSRMFHQLSVTELEAIQSIQSFVAAVFDIFGYLTLAAFGGDLHWSQVLRSLGWGIRRLGIIVLLGMSHLIQVSTPPFFLNMLNSSASKSINPQSRG